MSSYHRKFKHNFDLLDNKGINKDEATPAEGLTSGNTLLIIVAVVALLLLVMVFVLARKKKKVVYLKPKKSSEPNAQQQGYTPPPTESNYNEDVLRSQIKSLRQSAVSMSAGQKEGASQIISDWLDEGDGGEELRATQRPERTSKGCERIFRRGVPNQHRGRVQHVLRQQQSARGDFLLRGRRVNMV